MIPQASSGSGRLLDEDVPEGGWERVISQIREAQQALGELRHRGYVEFDDAADVWVELGKQLGRVGSRHEINARPASAARAGTLSATHGFGAFPWHTDGAIAASPPRYVALRSPIGSDTPTELLDLALNPDVATALGATLLRVRCHGDRYRYVMSKSVGREPACFRWDPHRCEAVGETAKPDLPDEQTPASHVVRWVPAHTVIFDNWRVLHRRWAITDAESPTRTLQRLYIYG